MMVVVVGRKWGGVRWACGPLRTRVHMRRRTWACALARATCKELHAYREPQSCGPQFRSAGLSAHANVGVACVHVLHVCRCFALIRMRHAYVVVVG